jgi:hypothetical protein
LSKQTAEHNRLIALPKGQLLVEADGSLIAQIRASRAARKDLRDWFDRLAASRPNGVLVHASLDSGGRGFEVRYERQTSEAVFLAAAIEQWRADPAISIPAILELGLFVLEVAGEIAGRGFADALMALTTIRVVPGPPRKFWLVPLPIAGTSLADWSRADPDTFLWVTRDTALGGAGLDPAYLLGAALHQAIAGLIVPAGLTAREKFSRLLRGRIGLPARVTTALATALPRSLEDDAAEFGRLITDCLEPNPGARPRLDSARKRLSSLTEKLAIERLIRYWGFENQQATVSRLEALVQRPPAPTGSTTEAAQPAAPVVPWDEQVPKLLARGDLTGALEAAWNDIHENGPPRIRFYLAVVQRMAARLPGPSTEVTAAIDRLVGTFSERLDESDVLRLAHIRMRHLGEKSDRFGTANRKFASRWNDATSQLMLARRMLTTGQAYNHVSRLCKEARGIYESMPEKGGKGGQYATAYLYLLDGIAHVGAVSLYKNETFYNDAFEQFGRALEMASRAGHDALTQACLRWFGWMGQFTMIAQGPPLSLLSAGIEAVLSSHGLTTASVAAAGVPEIPWYDENLLFPI